MNPVTFDRANMELRTLRFHFADKGTATVKISWESGVNRGAEVKPNQHLATIIWKGDEPERIFAPQACAGTVERTNRKIPYVMLKKASVFLLALKRS